MIHCARHPGRQAQYLCSVCGRWACSECIRPSSGQPVCAECRSAQARSGPSQPRVPHRWAAISYLSATAVLAVASVAFAVPYLWLVALATGVAAAGYALADQLERRPKRMAQRPRSSGKITDAQVRTALDMKQGDLTAADLARLTSTTEERAKQHLDQMFRDGKVDTSVRADGTILYGPPPDPHRLPSP